MKKIENKLHNALLEAKISTLSEYLRYVYDHINPNLEDETQKKFQFDMYTYSDVKDKICYGCMATACIINITETKPTQYVKQRSVKSPIDMMLDHYILQHFEDSVDDIRRLNIASLIKYVMGLANSLPDLYTYITKTYENEFDCFISSPTTFSEFCKDILSQKEIIPIYSKDDLIDFYANKHDETVVKMFSDIPELYKEYKKYLKEN